MVSTDTSKRLAELVFANKDLKQIDYYEQIYPLRDLPSGAYVTRFAPSPTGFMHIGGIYASLINKRLSEQSGGVFYLRIEDTDTKRFKEGAIETIVNGLNRFGLYLDEGVVDFKDGEVIESGDYGPYIQTHRAEIFHAYTAYLIQHGHAYPCFCTEEDLEKLRQEQKEQKIARSGYYGKWVRCRNLTIEQVQENLNQGKPFVIRLRATGDHNKRIIWEDAIRGQISMPENDLDIVLLKANGIPTYHLAYTVDDHLMRTTHIIRADEWLSSVPLHIQLFKYFSWTPPVFAHIPPIDKIDKIVEIDETGKEIIRESRRKLSKRKDPEANINFYFEKGFPEEATIEYLSNLFDSSYESWRESNPTAPYSEFHFSLSTLASHGAMSDIVKITSISKDVIARMSIDECYEKGLKWAEEFDPELAELMKLHSDYTQRSLDIERTGESAGKRIHTWQDLRPQLAFMYDELFAPAETAEFPENLNHEDIKLIVEKFLETYDESDDKITWFDRIKEIATEIGFADSVKAFKKAKGAFRGHVGDVAMGLRLGVCGRRQSPDLWEVLRVMGRDRVTKRLSMLT